MRNLRDDAYRWMLFLLFNVYVALAPSITGAQQPFGDAKKIGDDEDNRISIRNVSQMTGSVRQPRIEVELYSERVFPVLNAAVVLVIGENVFHGGGYGDTEGHVLVFKLIPEKFAKTKNGDEVIVAYQGADLKKVRQEGKSQGRVWKFGKLDKSKIDVAQTSQVMTFPHVVVKTPQDGNKMTIRSLLRIAGTTSRTVIEIEVKSDIPFHGGNNMHVLHIGTKKFLWARSGDASTNTLIFELTPEDFGKLKTGDEVSVTYGMNQQVADNGLLHRVWKFGKLDKSKIDK